MKRPMIEYIIEALEPTFAENIKDFGWCTMYTEGLDIIKKIMTFETLIPTLNGLIMCNSGGKKDAYVDVASCLESLCPEEYAGKFRY